MEKRTITMVFLMLITALFVQCGTKNGSEPEQTASITTSSNQDTVIEKKKEVLTKVLTKEKGEHADDIVVLTPEFIKAIQGYDEIGVFSEGLAAVKKDGKWGYINTKGEVAIPDTIQAVWSGRFSEGVAYVDVSHYFYLIDTSGKIVFKCEKGGGAWYDDCAGEGTFSEDMPYYVNGELKVEMMDWDEQGNTTNKVHVYDSCGNKTTIYLEETENLYKKAASSPYTIFEVEGESEYKPWYGVKDSKGKIVIPAQYGYLSGDYSNGVFLAGFIEGDAPEPTIWGYVDLKGNDTFSDEIKQRYGRKTK